MHDPRILRLIRQYLESGVMVSGVVVETEEGTPQGGPLSPFLSNIMLDDLDQELERRGPKFVRVADDCNIYVRTKRAGERVMQSAIQFLEGTLKLKVNREKSAVDRPSKRKFLGFSFYRSKGETLIRIATKSLKRIKAEIRAITSRPTRHSGRWTSGYADDCECASGSCGRTRPHATGNCATSG